MDMRNKTTVTNIFLVGFTGSHGMRILLFIVLLVIYIVTLLGNVTMIVIIVTEQALHTPMYFFLWNLSMLETFNISNIVPLMLLQIFSMHRTIPLESCFTQSFFYFYLATNAFLLMPIMSYDRYVAICNPLRYTTIMTGQLCLILIIGSWLGSLLTLLYPTIVITRLTYCDSNIIDHYFCDSSSIIKLACSDTQGLQLISVISALIILPGSLGLTIVSYILIISAILRIPSTNGRKKAFSTCSSHLTMVTICYGSAIFVDVNPAMNISQEVCKTVNMFSTIISPLMNPFVYTFRNEKVKEVLKKKKCCERHTVPIIDHFQF